MEILLLRFDAPLMSFGGVMVDQHGPTERFPGLSLLAGLFGNALGYSHREAGALEALQARIEYAARWDLAPNALLDYHTVDLGQEKMREPGWTTHGVPEHRGGGPDAKYGTHIRYRHYWANGVMTLAVALLESRGESLPPPAPNLDELAAALREPARPLFLGRKTCLPAAPLLLGKVDAPDVLDALRRAPRFRRPDCRSGSSPTYSASGGESDCRSGFSPTHDGAAAGEPDLRSGSSPVYSDRTSPAGDGGPDPAPEKLEACWPARLGQTPLSREVPIYDRRDWRNQIHAGRRLRIEGWLEVAP